MKLPATWTDFGARFGRDGLLYLNEWRKGFDVHELRAMFFHCQRVRSLECDLRLARAELEQLTIENARLDRERAFYRRQCYAEARLGLALVGIVGREPPPPA
jgi:hypothetical protein